MTEGIDGILAKLSPEAMLLEPREHYDDALVGASTCPQDQWSRKEQVMVAVYSYEKCLDVIAGLIGVGIGDDAAMEWFWYNTAGAWVGEGTPTFDVCICEEE